MWKKSADFLKKCEKAFFCISKICAESRASQVLQLNPNFLFTCKQNREDKCEAFRRNAGEAASVVWLPDKLQKTLLVMDEVCSDEIYDSRRKATEEVVETESGKIPKQSFGPF